MPLELGNERKDAWRWREIGETLGEAIKGTDVCLPCTVDTVMTGYGNVGKLHLTGICSVLLAVCTEHQYRLSARYSSRVWEQDAMESGSVRLCSVGEIERFV